LSYEQKKLEATGGIFSLHIFREGKKKNPISFKAFFGPTVKPQITTAAVSDI